MYSPLEQFDIVVLFELWLFPRIFEVTNSSLVLICWISGLVIVIWSLRYLCFIPSAWCFFVELFVKVLFKLVFGFVGNRGLVFFPFLLTLFIFIIGCNIMGLLPYGFTVTSHIVVTFFFSGTILLSCVLIGVSLHGVRFFKLFVSEEIPLVLFFIFILLELLSYCVRVFSLAVRLSANLLAGHVLLHLIANFFFVILGSGIIFFGLVFLGLLIVLLLELAVAVLQAYVFLVLSCLYLGEALYLH